MESNEERAHVVRRARIPEHLLPVPVYDTDAQPISAVWLAIVYWEHPTQPNRDRYELQFIDAEGQWLEGLLFDTLEIAVDQAVDIAGIPIDQWETVEIALAEDSDTAPIPD